MLLATAGNVRGGIVVSMFDGQGSAVSSTFSKKCSQLESRPVETYFRSRVELGLIKLMHSKSWHAG
jgi:hypothetical protein